MLYAPCAKCGLTDYYPMSVVADGRVKMQCLGCGEYNFTVPTGGPRAPGPPGLAATAATAGPLAGSTGRNGRHGARTKKARKPARKAAKGKAKRRR